MFDFTQLADVVWFYVLIYFPLGIVGLWRWTVWIIKKIYAYHYRVTPGTFRASVAVVTPVYNEDPEVFTQALASWRENKVDEFIAVIDYTDTTCISLFEDFAKTNPGAKLIVTKKPGKRPALVDGIEAAESEIVALVDSDTIWGENVKEFALAPFQDSAVGGVATRQSVLKPVTLAHKIFNAQLNLRYLEEMPFMTALGGTAVTCISGRTGFYRRSAVMPLLGDLLHETFWGRPVISGDDKRLTYLLEGAGWKVAFQQNAHVYTPGMPRLKNFLKQRLRWSRNSWRADLRTLTKGWIWRHPRLTFYLIDRALQPFALLISPLFLLIALLMQQWAVAIILVAWWHLSRVIRMYPHLRQRPQDIVLLPVYILLNYYLALVKIYALVTLNRQGWITRWDSNRLPGAPPWLRAAGAYAGTGCLIGFLASGVFVYNEDTFGNTTHPGLTDVPPVVTALPSLPDASIAAPVLERYVVARGDTMNAMLKRFGLTEKALIQANSSWLPSREFIVAGMALTIPRQEIAIVDTDVTADHEDIGQLRAVYDAPSNTIEVRGRGQQVNLSDLRKLIGSDQIKEVAPGEWYVTSNIHLRTGVTLKIDQSEVAWLKLASNPQGFVWLRATSGQINVRGSKITSWDNTAGKVDEELRDGRSYILASHSSRLDLYDAEVAYVGYDNGPDNGTPAYGIAWKNTEIAPARQLLTGEVVRSRFHHNYHGLYASGTYGLRILDSEFAYNRQYGIDLYGLVTRSLVQGNAAHHNGLHGMIVAEKSEHNVLQNNHASANQAHGIMLHAQSSNNVVRRNAIDRQQDGIVIHGSHNNIIHNNKLEDNGRGVRLSAQSTENMLVANTLLRNARYGFYLAENSDQNFIADNTLLDHHHGIYIKTNANEIVRNAISQSHVGIYLHEPAHDNRLIFNNIQRGNFGVYVKTTETQKNGWSGTTFSEVARLVN